MITSFRMYNATPAAAAAWRALFERVFADLALAIEVVEHKWPQPIEMLWAEPELCCAFMCGWPFSRAPRMQPIAAPVPSPPRYQGLPRYCSEFLARAQSGWTRLEDAFGHRFGYMAENSHSGFNAPRGHLARFLTPERPRLFSEVIGPLGNPAKSLEALVSGKVDLVALDGFYLDLVRAYEPAKLAHVRTIATTDWMPIPLLVAAPSIPGDTIARLRDHLTIVHGDPAYRPLLAATLLERFGVPDLEAYSRIETSTFDDIP